MVFGTFRSKEHFLLKRFIEINCVFGVLSQCVDFDVAGQVASLLTGKEHILLF